MYLLTLTSEPHIWLAVPDDADKPQHKVYASNPALAARRLRAKEPAAREVRFECRHPVTGKVSWLVA